MITGPPDSSDHSFHMINLFLDKDAPGGVGWTAIRPSDASLHCYAMDINKRGCTVALLQDGQDGSRHPFLGSWPRKADSNTCSQPKRLLEFNTSFRILDGWSEAYQVRISHELNIAVCFVCKCKTGRKAEVIGVKLSSNFDTASILFQMQRKFGTMGPLDGQMLAVSSLHFALHHHDPFDYNYIDMFDVRNGTVLKTYELPKCTNCDYPWDEVPFGMSMSEKKLWVGWGNHRTLLLRFS